MYCCVFTQLQTTYGRLPTIMELTGTMQDTFIASKQSVIADARRQAHVAAFEEMKCLAYASSHSIVHITVATRSCLNFVGLSVLFCFSLLSNE